MNDEELVAELRNVLRLFKGDGIGKIKQVLTAAAARIEQLSKSEAELEFLIDSQTKL